MTVTDAVRDGGVFDRTIASANLSDRYDAIVESTDDAIVATSLDATILSWNPGAERIYGFPAEQAIGQRLSLIVPADRAGETVRLLHSVGQGRHVDRIDTVRTRRDGSRFDASVIASAIAEPSGRITGALTITRDLTGTKPADASMPATMLTRSEAWSLLDKTEQLSHTSTWVLELGAHPSLVWSKEAYRELGLDPATPMTIEGFFELVHPDDRAEVQRAMGSALSEHRAYETQHRLVRSDGAVRWLHVWAEPEYDEHGEALRVLGVAQDITERHAADEALRASEQRFRLLTENARDLIFRISLVPEPRCEYMSPASVAITGYTPEELYLDPLLATGLIAPDQIERMEKLHDIGGLSDPVDFAVRRKDGSVIWVSQQLTFVNDDSGDPIAVEGIARDITERKRAEDDLAYAGLHDALTGLPNRLLLRERLDLARVRATSESRSIIVVALDLDDFTLLNDTHGHDTGDAVLIAVARMLSDATGGHAMVARTGSDEFVVVGEDIANDADAARFVAGLRHSLMQPIAVDGTELFVHARIGVSVDASPPRPESLLRNADIALARAKQQRTGPGIEFFNDAMRTRTNERFALVGTLHHALERGEFELRYQPIVRLADNHIVGVEALIRWQHPERGLMGPVDFIPLAEDTGLIVEIGAWVLEHACTQLRILSRTAPQLATLGMSVNVSVKQLRSPGIVNTVIDALAASGIDAGRLTIEMTESVFVDDLESIGVVLAQLRALGVRIAVDDFGTGYSSLAYLKHLPLDTLKIDRSFIDDLPTDACDEAIVGSALNISKAMGLLAVAEGVETSAQLAALRALGCEAAQGFYFAPPMTAADLLVFVGRRHTW